MYTMPSTVSNTTERVPVASNLAEYVSLVAEADLQRWKTKRVKPSRLPLPASDPTPGITVTDLDNRGSDSWVNVCGVIPVAAIPGLPAQDYPSYMPFLLRATLASFSLPYCSLASSMLDGFGRTLAAVVVAARCGIWASTGVVPPLETYAPAVAECVVYREDTQKVVRDCATRHKKFAGWYWLLDRIEGPSRILEELMVRVAHVSPVLLDMACGELSRHGTSYAQPYVERAVSSYLKAKLSPEAYRIGNFNKRLVWSTLRDAVTFGMPKHLLDRWARDSAFHVQAHRRLLTSTVEIEQSRLDERAAKTRSDVVPVVPDDVPDADADDELAAALRAAASLTPDSDLMTEDGLSEWGGADESEVDAGEAELWEPDTVVPTREGTPPPPVTEIDRQTIQDAIRDAAAQGPRADSELRDARDDLTVEW